MARGKVGDTVLKVRVSDGLALRLDAVSGSRSDVVRAAIEDWLDRNEVGGSGSGRAAKTVGVEGADRQKAAQIIRENIPGRERRGSVARDWLSDGPAVLEAMGSSRYSSRDLARRLGWPDLRLERVLAAMEAAGQIRFERGVVVKA